MIFLIFLTILLTTKVVESHDDMVEIMLFISAIELLIEMAIIAGLLFK